MYIADNSVLNIYEDYLRSIRFPTEMANGLRFGERKSEVGFVKLSIYFQLAVSGKKFTSVAYTSFTAISNIQECDVSDHVVREIRKLNHPAL